MTEMTASRGRDELELGLAGVGGRTREFWDARACRCGRPDPALGGEEGVCVDGQGGG